MLGALRLPSAYLRLHQYALGNLIHVNTLHIADYLALVPYQVVATVHVDLHLAELVAWDLLPFDLALL